MLFYVVELFTIILKDRPNAILQFSVQSDLNYTGHKTCLDMVGALTLSHTTSFGLFSN